MAQIRVSIANLAMFAGESGFPWAPFGIINQKKLAEGKRWYMALGGAAMLNEEGKRLLEQVVGATHFEFDKDTGFYDARFRIDERDLESVFNTFSQESSERYERDRTLDIMMELTGKEFPGTGPIFTSKEAERLQISYYQTVQQMPAEKSKDTSEKAATTDIPTRRLFRLFGIIMPTDLFRKFKSSPAVRFLSYKELATTDGGSKAGRTSDGCVIQNNLFLV